MKPLNNVLEKFDADGGVLPQNLDVHSQRLKAEAYAEGYAAGEAATLATLESKNTFLEGVAEKVGSELASVRIQQATEFTSAFKNLVSAVFPVLAKRGFEDEARAAFESSATLCPKGKIVIVIHPEHKTFLDEIICASEKKGDVVIECDKSKPKQSLSINWRKAGLDIDYDKTINGCLEQLEQALGRLRTVD